MAYKLNNIFMENLILIDSKKAFEEAINMKILSENKAEINFAGNFMYMGTKNGLHQFKHIDTRKYGFDLKSINEAAINVWFSWPKTFAGFINGNFQTLYYHLVDIL